MASPRANSTESTPICRCRVLYLGSSVPHITKDGLQGIQEPLRELYPDQGASGARGIDSWLSVWSNGLLLENVDENHKKVTRFFPIESLHYCAAVRYVLVQPPSGSPNTSVPPRFLPLDSPFARNPSAQHPPLFAAILRRTTGIKVLECHAFICKREMAANALVKCCFHAYADASYAKQIEGGGGGSKYSTLIKQQPGKAQSVIGDITSPIDKVEGWRTNGHAPASTNGNNTLRSNAADDDIDNIQVDEISIYNGDENHKVWAGQEDYSASTLRSVRSMGGTRAQRPRQMIAPAKTPPPPPIPMMDDDQSTLKKNKKLKSKKSRDEMLYGPPMMNGSLMRPATRNGGAHSVNGTMMRPTYESATLMRPINGYGHGPQPMMIYGPPMPPPHHMMATAGTYSHKSKNKKGMMQPQFIMPPHMPPPPPPIAMKRGGKYYQEEPIYMPANARPLSPVASYQPGHFPHDAYIHQMLPPQNGPYIPPPTEQSTLVRPVNKKKSKSKKSSGGEEESPFNTGIYRKKGHMNERAFSYSIRQEHRSRSYGSLASLKFSENGSPIKEDNKKEREIMQMMADLELTPEEIMQHHQQQHQLQNGNNMNGHGHHNNHQHGGYEPTRPIRVARR